MEREFENTIDYQLEKEELSEILQRKTEEQGELAEKVTSLEAKVEEVEKCFDEYIKAQNAYFVISRTPLAADIQERAAQVEEIIKFYHDYKRKRNIWIAAINEEQSGRLRREMEEEERNTFFLPI